MPGGAGTMTLEISKISECVFDILVLFPNLIKVLTFWSGI